MADFCHFYLVTGYYGIILVVCVSICVSYVWPSVFLFPGNLSKFQWIFTKLGMYIDIVEVFFLNC